MNTLIKEIENIFYSVYGGLYLEVNPTKQLDYLKERKWDSILFDEMEYELILDQLNNINLSTLIHVWTNQSRFKIFKKFINGIL